MEKRSGSPQTISSRKERTTKKERRAEKEEILSLMSQSVKSTVMQAKYESGKREGMLTPQLKTSQEMAMIPKKFDRSPRRYKQKELLMLNRALVGAGALKAVSSPKKIKSLKKKKTQRSPGSRNFNDPDREKLQNA